MTKLFARLSHWTAEITGLIANLLLVAMLLAIGTQVVARFVVGAPTVWAEELARFLLVAITMVGGSVAQIA
ncbi:TRAP transporter small permease subunit [Thioclava sp. F36-7]|uniref:TRAP transporter small permease subunit n=1 Tax=Thioclava sp. F36-7 TaxID=1915317 RepID=UPI000998B121|nr:TRAP transporter small permease subunit [Thioclava sp. F36-7]OOY07615.1 hypothetical protein BMI89_16120 [Thioclava sp. F36-7]